MQDRPPRRTMRGFAPRSNDIRPMPTTQPISPHQDPNRAMPRNRCAACSQRTETPERLADSAGGHVESLCRRSTVVPRRSVRACLVRSSEALTERSQGRTNGSLLTGADRDSRLGAGYIPQLDVGNFRGRQSLLSARWWSCVTVWRADSNAPCCQPAVRESQSPARPHRPSPARTLE